MAGGGRQLKTLIVFDSQSGNTELIARSIGSGIGGAQEVRVIKVDQVRRSDLSGVELLLVGSPTQAWRSTTNTRQFLEGLEDEEVRGIFAASFDTGFRSRLSGSAFKGIERKLRRKGAVIAKKGERFYVEDMTGPLEEGELNRARDWGAELAFSVDQARQMAA